MRERTRHVFTKDLKSEKLKGDREPERKGESTREWKGRRTIRIRRPMCS